MKEIHGRVVGLGKYRRVHERLGRAGAWVVGARMLYEPYLVQSKKFMDQRLECDETEDADVDTRRKS